MKQAFNGTIYDTEMATLLGRNPPDFLGRSRYLYRTPKGAFFLYQVTESLRARDVLHTIGTGLYTAYRRKRDQKITPLTASQAIEEYSTLEVRCLDFAEAFPDNNFIDSYSDG